MKQIAIPSRSDLRVEAPEYFSREAVKKLIVAAVRSDKGLSVGRKRWIASRVQIKTKRNPQYADARNAAAVVRECNLKEAATKGETFEREVVDGVGFHRIPGSARIPKHVSFWEKESRVEGPDTATGLQDLPRPGG